MSDFKVQLVNSSGEADWSVTIVGDQVIDLTGASEGDLLAVGPDGTVSPTAPSETQAGVGLAWAESSAAVPIIGTEADIDGMTVDFTVGARDVVVTADVPLIGAVTASSVVTIKLCDASGVMKKQDSVKSGTASANHGHLTIKELIPAGTGPVTRKLRAVSTGADGYANLGGASTMILDAVVR